MPSISTTIPNVKIYDSLEEFDRNLPETVTLLRDENGSKVYLIGTAHFSEQSQNDVSLVMQNVRPDKLVLELCPMRLHILYYDEERLLREAEALNAERIREIYRQHGMLGGMFYIKFLNINASVTRQLGMAPGGECRRALAEAKQLPNCEVLLGDRSISVTMQRAIHSMTLLEKFYLSMFYMFFRTNTKITQEDVEKLKSRTATKMRNSASHGAPDGEQPLIHGVSGIYTAFVHERDMLLSHSLHVAASSTPHPVKVVGVVGIGHSAGILHNWQRRLTPGQLDELLALPAEKITHQFARRSFKFGALAVGGYAIYRIVHERRKGRND